MLANDGREEHHTQGVAYLSSNRSKCDECVQLFRVMEVVSIFSFFLKLIESDQYGIDMLQPDGRLFGMISNCTDGV